MPLRIPHGRSVLLGVLLSAPFLASPAAADVVEIVSGRDNTLYESSGGTLSNGAGPSFFAGRTAQATNSIRRGLVWFDVAGAVPAGATVLAAQLRLSLTATSGGTHDVALHRVNASWGEGASNAGDSGGGGAPAQPGDATWRHRSFSSVLWATAGGEFAAVPSATIPVGDLGDYTWPSSAQLVADVAGWLAAPASNHGWLLRGVESSQPSSRKFESRESTLPALRPVLTVEYEVPVPAPGTSWGRIKSTYR
jgi:hypothetical protein